MKLNYKKHISWFIGFAIFFALIGCNGGGGNVQQSHSKEIQTFSLTGDNGSVNGTITGESIAVTMPFRTGVTGLIATFTTTGTSVKVESTVQKSGLTPNDFTLPVVYTVTAADKSTAKYTVTVTVALNPAKAITAYSLSGYPSVITGESIAVTMPFRTGVTGLIATFTTTGTSVKVESTAQISGLTPNNFKNPVVYTVTAADKSTATYTVTVKVAPKSAKDIISYYLDGSTGVITGQNIAVTMPFFETNVTGLIATFITLGASVQVESIAQTSGITRNNFTNPLSYVVTAHDGTQSTYVITVKLLAFTAYYPVGCTLNNTAGSVMGNCSCIKDIATGKIWGAYRKQDSYKNWCNHNSQTVGFDKYCDNTRNLLDAWNETSQCGLTGGWHLPLAGAASQATLNRTNPGGDWSNLYNIATSGTKPPGSDYLPGGNIITWMKNNGFNVDDGTNSFFWTAQALNYDNAWIVNTSFSIVDSISESAYINVLLVHEPVSQ